MRTSLACAAALAALGLSSPVVAQQPVHVGPLLGVNMADVAGDDFSDVFGDTESRLGFAFGGFVEFGISERITLRPEVTYSQKGTKIEGGIADATLELEYIQVPVLARFMLGGPGTGPRFSVFLGPAAGFSTGCTFDVDEDIVVSAGPSLAAAAARIELDCADIGAETRGVEFAGVFGVGVDLDRFTFDVRYDRGFTGIFDADDVDSRNQSFSVRAGYRFRAR